MGASRLSADTAIDTRRLTILNDIIDAPLGTEDSNYPTPNLTLPFPLTDLHGHYLMRVLAYFALADQGQINEAQGIATGNQLLRFAVNRWPANGPADVTGQYASAWDHHNRTLATRIYYLYRDYLDPDILAKYEQRMGYAVTTHTESSSENIRFTTNALIYLAHENQNQTGASTWSGTRTWMIDNLRQRGEDGFFEAAAYYQHWTLSAIQNIAEFAEDSTVRNLAIAVLDRALGGFAPYSMEGRVYQPGIRNKPYEIEAANTPQTQILEMYYYRDPLKSQNVEWAASNYLPPVAVGTMLANSRKVSSVKPETKSRTDQWPQYSYSLTRIGIATHQTIVNGRYAGTHDVGACKIYSNYGKYSSAAVFGIPRGADNDSTSPPSIYPQPNWLSVNDRSFGYKGMAIVNGGGKCQRVFYGGQWAYNVPVRLWYGSDFTGSVVFDSGWAFLSNGNSYIAWAPLTGNPGHDPDTTDIQNPSFGRYLVSSHSPSDNVGEYSIVEVGDLEEYGSFANFRSNILSRNGSPHSLLSGGEVTYVARDGTVVKVGSTYAKLDGVNVNPQNYPRFSATLSNGSSISGNVFTVGGTSYTFNWTTGIVSPAFTRVSVDRTYGSVTPPAAPSGLIYEDTFEGSTSGQNLNGSSTEVGGGTWSANGNTKFGNNDNVTGVSSTSAIAGLPFDPTSYSGEPVTRVSANIDPAGSNWVGLGFSSSAQGGYWSDGQFWVLLRPAGTYKIWTDGTNASLGEGSIPNFVSGSVNLLEIEYRPASNEGLVTINGTEVLSATSLGFTPSIANVGVHIYSGTNNTTTMDDFSVEVLQQVPYNVTQVIPGTIQVEDYDLGGEGYAYHDTTAGNTGGGYRSDDVDIRASSGDSDGTPNVGWVADGEYLEYTVDVNCNATYNIGLRVATPNTGAVVHLELNDVDITGSITIPNTGGWSTWQTTTVNGVVLEAADNQILKLVIDSAALNINWISFTPISVAPDVEGPLPMSQTVNIGEDFQFQVSATEECPYTFQWQFDNGSGFSSLSDGGRISGTTSSVLEIINAQESDEGEYRCVVSNLHGNTASDAAPLLVYDIQEPFNVSPFIIDTSAPVRIEAEEYDLGGEGVAYHDTTAGNSGSSSYRSVENEDVDLYDITDGVAGRGIGYLAADEWTEYTASIEGGTYDIKLRVASAVSGSTFHLEVDGVPVTGTQTVPNTGGWGVWTTITIAGVQLPDSGSGTSVIQVAYDSGAWNFNWIEFTGISRILPNDDCYVYKNEPTSAHDADGLHSGFFSWGGFGTGAERQTFIEVTLGTSAVSEAKLWLYWQQVDSTYNGSIKGAQYGFDETALTWNNKPNISSWSTVVGSLSGTISVGWHGLDITTFYNNHLGQTVTFAIVGSVEYKDGYFEDREGSRTGDSDNGPYIELVP